MDKKKLGQFLKTVKLFDALGSRDMKRLEDAVSLRTYQKGQSIVTQGESGDEFFVLLSGTADAQRRVPASELFEAHTLVTEFVPGDHFGELALLNNAPRAASVIATSDCTLAVVSRKDFDEILGPLKETLKKNAAMRYGVQRSLEKNVPRHRSTMVGKTNGPTQAPHRTYQIVEVHNASLPHLQSAPGMMEGGVNSGGSSSGGGRTMVSAASFSMGGGGGEISPGGAGSLLGPKLISVHLFDKRGFSSCAKHILNSHQDLVNLLARERALCLGPCDDAGQQISFHNTGEAIAHYAQLEHGKHYCLLYDSRRGSVTARG